ncbi:MAG: ATP-binding protein [Clostridium sp.]|nr:ATP-binding protein [Clostridium sp.]
MSAGFTFSACSFFYSVLLTIMFFSKKRIQTLENKIYSYLIISNLVGVVLGVSCYTSILHRDAFPILNDFISKALLIYYLTWISFFTAYTFVISYSKKESDKESKEKYFKNIFNILAVIYIVIAILVFILPLNYFSKSTIAYSFGPSANLLYILIPVYICICLIEMFKNFKEIKNKKYLPLFAFIIIGTVVMIIQKLNPGLLLMTSMETFVTFLMYFTIENPDIKMIEELTKTKSLVEKNNNDKSIFIFNTTQQIRHPLNMIEQRTEQLLEDELNDDEKEKVIDIRNAQQRIAYILRGVMDVSTIDAKNIKIVKNQYKVANLLTEITLRSKQEATEKGLEFRTNFDEAIPEMLYGDSIRLKQIINALISNAIKYTKEGFVELNVNSIVSFDVCRLVVSVKDSGIGVNAEDINKLFQSKTDENDISDKVDESNVTLDVAKKMVNLIGGTITVRSEKNKGSEFTLIVDQKIASSNDKIDNIINEYKKTEDKIKILLVDDNEEERTLLTKKLGGISKLTIAKNGEEGLKRIRNKEKYDVLLIKESMEKLDAYQTIKKAKILEFVPDKIIVLADNKEEEEKLTINGYNAIFFDTSEQQFIKKLNNIIKK